MRRLPVHLVLALIAAVAPSSLAQKTSSAGCPQTIALPVSVTWRVSGTAITDIGPEGFRVRVRGHKVPLASAALDHNPHRTMVVLDMSGSMLANNKLKLARDLAIAAIEALPEQDSFGLLTFAARVEPRSAPEETRDAVIARIRALPTDTKARRSAAFDALIATVGLFGVPRFGDSILFITDGGDSASKSDLYDVRRLLEHSPVRVFVLALAHTQYPDSHTVNAPGIVPEAAGVQVSQAIAGVSLLRANSTLGLDYRDSSIEWPAITGGEGFQVDLALLARYPEKVIPEVRRRLAAYQRDFYRLEFDVGADPEKRHGLVVEVVNLSGKSHDLLRVTYPEKAGGCQQVAAR